MRNTDANTQNAHARVKAFLPELGMIPPVRNLREDLVVPGGAGDGSGCIIRHQGGSLLPLEH